MLSVTSNHLAALAPSPADVPGVGAPALHAAASPAARTTSTTAAVAVVAPGASAEPAAAGAQPAARGTTSRRTTQARSSKTGYATAAKPKPTKAKKATPSAAAAKKDALSFLSDPKLSTEDKLFLFLLHVTEKYDRQVEDMMRKALGDPKAPGKTGTSGSSTAGGTTAAKKKKKGLLGSIGSAVKTLFPAVGVPLELLKMKEMQALLKVVSGPVLAAGATALGMPQLAPILLKAGPQIAGLAGGLAEALDAEITGGSGGGKTVKSFSAVGTTALASAASGGSARSSAASGTASTGAAVADIDKKTMLELEHLVNKEKQMFTLISNMLKAMHDTKMSVIANVR